MFTQQVSSESDGILSGANRTPFGGYSIKSWLLPFTRYKSTDVNTLGDYISWEKQINRLDPKVSYS
jgi:hypothetical protein